MLFLFFTVPSLLTKVLKSIDEKLLTDLVLLKQIRVLVEEWKKYESMHSNHFIHISTSFKINFVFFFFCSKVACLQTISSNQDVAKVKKVLGIQAHDQPLITYWSSNSLMNQ